MLLFPVSHISRRLLLHWQFQPGHIWSSLRRLVLLLLPRFFHRRRGDTTNTIGSGRAVLIVVDLLQERVVSLPPRPPIIYGMLLRPSPSILLLSAIASLPFLNQPLPFLFRLSHVPSFAPHFTACFVVILDASFHQILLGSLVFSAVFWALDGPFSDHVQTASDLIYVLRRFPGGLLFLVIFLLQVMILIIALAFTVKWIILFAQLVTVTFERFKSVAPKCENHYD